jgi:maltose O-acetyltransferase
VSPVPHDDLRRTCFPRSPHNDFLHSNGYPPREGYRVNMTATTVRDELINRFIRYPEAVASRLRIARLRLLGVRIGRKCWIRRIHVPRNPWDIVIADGVALDDYVVLLTTGSRGNAPRLVIDGGSYVNRFTMFDASESIEMGQDCLVGPFCYITDHDHGVDADRSIAEQPLVGSPVRIGSRVWIGAGAIIGNGAVIGAGAVVTRHVRSGEKVAGVPARTVGSRFPTNSNERAHGLEPSDV